MKVTKSKLILTNEEIATLRDAVKILDTIANKMERAIQVEWSEWSDNDIWDVCDIIYSFLE